MPVTRSHSEALIPGTGQPSAPPTIENLLRQLVEAEKRSQAAEARSLAAERRSEELLARLNQATIPQIVPDQSQTRREDEPREEHGETSHRPGKAPATGDTPVTDEPLTSQKLQEMMAEFQKKVMNDLRARSTDDQALRASADSVQSPFSIEITREPFPRKFVMPRFTPYDGTKDPEEHIYQIHQKMTMYAENEALLCKVFPTSLIDAPLLWFRKQPPRSIGSWQQLSDLFVAQYFGNKRQKKTISSLFTMTQEKGESLKSFLSRFNVESSSIDNCDQHSAVEAFRMALIPGTKFHQSLVKRPPSGIGELNSRAQGHLRIEEEEATRQKRAALVSVEVKSKEKASDKSRHDINRKRSNPPSHSSSQFPPQPDRRPKLEEKITPLKVTLAKLFQENKARGIFQAPPPIRQPLDQRDRSKHCALHGDFGHTTNDCRNLRRQVEGMIARGELKDYIQRDGPRANPPAQYNNRNQGPAQPVRIINMIHGGPDPQSSEGSRRTQMRRAHQIARISGINEVHHRTGQSQILFSQEDLRDIQVPHEDPLVITLMVSGCLVKRVMVDPGSSANIMTKWAFDKLEINPSDIVTSRNPIAGFDGKQVEPLGEVRLPVTAAQRTLSETFVVVDVKPSYNLLMGRGWIHRMQGVPSTLHQMMRCVGPNGYDIIDIRGDQVAAKQCYAVTIKEMKDKPDRKRSREDNQDLDSK